MKNQRNILAITLASSVLTGHVISQAEGFRNPTAGAVNLGRSGGRIAHIDNASAITQNPANLMDLTTPEVTVSFNPIYISVEHQNISGNPAANARTENAWKFLPTAYASMPIKDGKYTIGVGITSPYGLSNEWENSGGFADVANPNSLRYSTAHFSELQTMMANPTIAFKLADNLSMGVGIDVMWSQLTFRNHVFPDGRFVAQGDGVGVGANLGITWEFAEGHRLAFTARSPITVEYEGDFNMSVPAATLNLNTSFDSEIEFPTQLHFGYGVEVTDTVRLEADVEFLEFSNFDTLPTMTGVPIPGLPSSILQDWHNTYTLGIGGDWKFAENWVFRASYQFFESPVPHKTFSPTIPDSNQNVITVGIGYGTDTYSVDLGYGLVMYDDRNINQGGNYDGVFEFAVHLFALTYTQRF